MNQYVKDFSKVPLSSVYGLEEPEDQISTLNKLFTDCLESHARRVKLTYTSTRRVKLTCSIAPWIKNPTIVSDCQKLELSRIKSRDSKNPRGPKKTSKIPWKIKSNTRKLLKIKRIHFFVKRCHQKILKPYGILLIVYSINNKKE